MPGPGADGLSRAQGSMELSLGPPSTHFPHRIKAAAAGDYGLLPLMQSEWKAQASGKHGGGRGLLLERRQGGSSPPASGSLSYLNSRVSETRNDWTGG